VDRREEREMLCELWLAGLKVLRVDPSFSILSLKIEAGVQWSDPSERMPANLARVSAVESPARAL
jgi:hypothetical protein